MLALDHIVIAALDLDQGAAFVENALGVTLQTGGVHHLMATHNKLLRLDLGAYLEVIAPDPAGSHQRPRWFSLDEPEMQQSLLAGPRLITWVVNTTDIASSMQQLGLSDMPILNVSRGELSWKIAVPHDGVMRFSGALPTLIEWPAGVHPFQRLEDKACALRHLTITHPDAAKLEALFKPFLIDPRIRFATGDTPSFVALIDTPSGNRTLR